MICLVKTVICAAEFVNCVSDTMKITLWCRYLLVYSDCLTNTRMKEDL